MSEELFELAVCAEHAGMRLDVFVSGGYGEKSDVALIPNSSFLIHNLTRTHAQKLIGQGGVTVNGLARSKNYLLREGDAVAVRYRGPEPLAVQPQALELQIVYEDDALAVVCKPRGMVVHPAAGNADGTMVNALLYHLNGRLSGIGGVIRPGIVHRLDKDTSGLLIVAKTDRAHVSLAAQIKAHSFRRKYRALVCGVMKDAEGRIDRPIGRDERNRKRMAVGVRIARPAQTLYTVLQTFPASGASYLELELLTGRTHQIRVHMASLGRPVLGDALYGGERELSKRLGLAGQCLHAEYIAFRHPDDGRWMEFDSPLPDYFVNALNALEKRERSTV